MSKLLITPAMLELRATIEEAEQISAKPELSKRDESRISVLLAKIAALRQAPVAPNDTTKKWMRAILNGQDPGAEYRAADLEAGTQTLSYTAGNEGGFLVPQEFHDQLVLGLSANDPFLDPTVVTLRQSSTFKLRPYVVPGWDLSTFAATKVGESNQRTAQTVPPAAKANLNNYTYAASLSATLELEEDDFEPLIEQIQNAYVLAFAKGIGADLVTGNGTTAPQGLVTGAADSGLTTAGAAAIDYTDIENIYFSVNSVYRNAPKCAWAFNDTIYQQVRKAHDTNGRPLINVVGDQELLMGKPIRISPTMSNTAGAKGIVFGDLSYFIVRASRMAISRNLQAPGYVEYGKVLYTARMRADAKVFDPTGGASSGLNSPIKYATLHA